MSYYRWTKQRLDTLYAPGLKIWSNGIPLKLDLWQSCTSFCRFCFSKEMRDMTLSRNGIRQNPQVARLVAYQSLINSFERAFRGEDNVHPFMNWALRNKYFIELGTTGETFQEADLDLKVTDSFMRLASSLEIPLFINTKLNLICHNEEYKQLLINYKAPIIISLSLTTIDDKLGKLYEPLAPLPSERLRTVKELSQYSHIKTIAYISPFIPSVTNQDTETFINTLIDNNIIGGHLRDFFLQGQTFKNPFWQKYMLENRDSLESFPGGYHIKYQVKADFVDKAIEIGRKRNKDFFIVGMKTKFFDFDTNYGKGVYDILGDDFKKGIVDFTIIPILRKIKENPNQPQLLLWDKLGYKKGKIKYPNYIRSNEGDINNLMDTNCNCNKSEVELRIEGYQWLTDGLWEGFEGIPSGFISRIEGIYPVKKKDNFYKEDNFIYAYIPKEYNHLLKSENKQILLFEPSINELENPYIDYKDTKDFIIPERVGGIEDKWLKR
uniref:Radical SAM superfamily protein n=1 Tax=viral metagenome TaxID=1070528 RepID=A0A6M3L153_9ZZZZ